MSERTYDGIKVRSNTMRPGEVVVRHAHKGGHFTVVIGHVRVGRGDEAFEIVNSGFWVPPGVAHEFTAISPTTYWCVGEAGF